MALRPTEKEVDTHTVRWLIGAIAFVLPTTLIVASVAGLLDLPTSISASYIQGMQWPRDVFVGAMFALAALLLAYNGGDGWDFAASKVACLGALVLATNRCKCDALFVNQIPMPAWPDAHAFGTALVIAVLLYFCVIFFRRARTKLRKAMHEGRVDDVKYIRRRMHAYGAAFLIQAFAVFPYLAHSFSDSKQEHHGVFWAEAMTLYAFALCWFTSARTNAYLERKPKRQKLFRPEQSGSDQDGQP